MKAITTNLDVWDPAAAANAAEALREIEDHPGLRAIFEAVDARKVELTSRLLTSPPSENAADKERQIGVIAGLEQFPLIVAGIIDNGRKAEARLRAERDQED